MKLAKPGLPGSVLVIGLVYVAAMVAAPETGLSAQIDTTQTHHLARFGSKTELVDAGVAASSLDGIGAIEPGKPIAHPRSSEAIRTCPHTSGATMSFSEFVQVHRRLPNRPSEAPSVARPAWGKAKLTVF